MKTVKPNNMSLLFRTHLLDKKDVLTISAFAAFKFEMIQPRLLDEQELWNVVKSSLPKDEILDLGIPKPRGEYLIYGNAYSQKPVSGIGVYANIGSLSKTIVVIGDRNWTTFGVSNPKSFVSMPIDYYHAFGGISYPENPLGKGITTNQDGKIYLPNIENPSHPITNIKDRPLPTGFNAYSITTPQRMQYMGKVNDNYLHEFWPGLPQYTNPEIFNAAPDDQRFNGFFVGDEKFILKNMHPQNQTQTSQLPEIRLRLFVVQKDINNEDIFKEVSNVAETLWLFPNHEIGALLFRGSLTVSDEEYSDVSKLFATWENLDEEKKPIEFYFQQFMINNETLEDEPVAESPIETIEKTEESAEKETIEDEQTNEIPSIGLADSLASLQELQKQLADKYKALGIDPTASLQKSVSREAQNTQSLDLTQISKHMTDIKQDIMQKNNLNDSDVEKILKNQSKTTVKPLSETLENISQGGIAVPSELLANLTKLNQINLQTQKSIENAANKEKESPLEFEENDESTINIDDTTTVTLLPLTLDDIQKKYQQDKIFSNLNFDGLDLSNQNFKNAIFNSCNFRNTNFTNTCLEGSSFNYSFFIETNFSNAALNNANINYSYFNHTNFETCSMSQIKIENSDINNCNFTQSRLNQAEITTVIFEQNNFENCNAEKSIIINSMLTNCNLSFLNLNMANLSNSDLSMSNITNIKLTSANAVGLKLNGCTGNAANFEKSIINNSRADSNTVLANINLKYSEIKSSSWDGAQLENANLSNAILDNSNFSNTNLKGAKLELVTAKQTNFSKAFLQNADLNRINLFKGSLRRSNLVNVDLRYSNLYGVDFYKSITGRTNLTGANLDQTLLSATGIAPKLI